MKKTQKEKTTVLVRDLMRTRVFSVTKEDNLSVASDLMDSRQIRHLPVIYDEGSIVGIVSQLDLVKSGIQFSNEITLEGQKQFLKEMRVEDVMTRDPVTISAEDSAAEAGEMLLSNQIRCLPVTEGSQLVGVVTESDFVQWLIDESREGKGKKRRVEREARDGLTGSSALGRDSELTGGGLIGGGMAGTRGTETGERDQSTVSGNWEGTDETVYRRSS